jgi:hypothetical protein
LDRRKGQRSANLKKGSLEALVFRHINWIPLISTEIDSKINPKKGKRVDPLNTVLAHTRFYSLLE